MNVNDVIDDYNKLHHNGDDVTDMSTTLQPEAAVEALGVGEKSASPTEEV